MSLFAALMGACNDSIVNRYIKDGNLKWSDDQIRELLEQRKVKLSDFLWNIVKEEKVKKDEFNIDRVLKFREAYNGRFCSDERWKSVVRRLDTLYSRSLADIVALSMVKQSTFDEKTPINWKRKKCGCSHKDELNGEVFGIFRLLNVIALVIAVGLIVCYFVSCRVSDFFNRHLALLLCIVVLPLGFTMALLLSLDPSVSGFGFLGMSPVLVLLVITIGIILHQVYIQNDLPKRRNR